MQFIAVICYSWFVVDLFCCSYLLLIGFCSKDCAKRKNLWTTVFAPMVSIQTVIGDHHLPSPRTRPRCWWSWFFDNRDVLSVAHTSLQEASIGEPWQPMDGYSWLTGPQHPWDYVQPSLGSSPSAVVLLRMEALVCDKQPRCALSRPHLPTRGFHRRTVTTYGWV